MTSLGSVQGLRLNFGIDTEYPVAASHLSTHYSTEHYPVHKGVHY